MSRATGATFAIALATALASDRTAANASDCSTDTFTIDERAVNVEICASRPAAAVRGKAAHAGGGDVRERLTVKGYEPLARSVRYETAAGGETARTLDDIPLQALGIERTMHVTLAVRDGAAHLEHALLVPGATPLK